MKKFILFIILVAICICGGYYVLNMQMFEKNLPKIELVNADNATMYWNPKNSLEFLISDDSGLVEIQTSFLDLNTSKEKLVSTQLDGAKELSLKFDFPKDIKYKNGDEFILKLKAKDISKSNFLAGNTTIKEIKIIIDAKAPDVVVINHSYKIIQGGAAVAVFRADDNIKINDIYIQSSFGKNFKVFPFYKDGYYAALLAWPSHEKTFSAQIVATDLAGNTAKTPIRFYLQNKNYKDSKLNISNNFIDGKITELVRKYANDPDALNDVAKFKFVNENLRTLNENKIKEITTSFENQKIDNFFIKPFYPLKNGAAVASFGDHRFFNFNGTQISQSYHLGIDLASTAAAIIKTSNPAKVVFAEDNGIYGLNLILYHGFGFYTLYGHCTNIIVNIDDEISENTNVATTGVSGLALGDHLHFGILIQGIEVRPEEWMDKKWMKENVFEILESSKKSIDVRKK